MRRARRLVRRVLRRSPDDESGSAVVEFVVLGLIMTLPVFYLVLTLARVQAGAYAVATASREAGRTFVTAPSEGQAAGRAQSAARIAFDDQGFPGQGSLALECDSSPCLTRDGHVHTRTSLDVQLPLVPGFVADIVPSSITVSATHMESVDRFRAEGQP